MARGLFVWNFSGLCVAFLLAMGQDILKGEGSHGVPSEGQTISLWVFLGNKRWGVTAILSDLSDKKRSDFSAPLYGRGMLVSLACQRGREKDRGLENMFPRPFWGCHLRVLFSELLQPQTHLLLMLHTISSYLMYTLVECVFIISCARHCLRVMAICNMKRIAISSLRKLRQEDPTVLESGLGWDHKSFPLFSLSPIYLPSGLIS